MHLPELGCNLSGFLGCIETTQVMVVTAKCNASTPTARCRTPTDPAQSGFVSSSNVGPILIGGCDSQVRTTIVKGIAIFVIALTRITEG